MFPTQFNTVTVSYTKQFYWRMCVQKNQLENKLMNQKTLCRRYNFQKKFVQDIK